MKTQSLRLVKTLLIIVLLVSPFVKTLAQCPTCASCIVINEFAVDPDTGENGNSSTTGEYVEIYNRCSESVNIGCFVICLTDATSGGRGECTTIPSGTSLAGGAVYVLGGYGTNCTGGETDCDWSGLSLNFNWHSSASSVWNVSGNSFFSSNSGNYIGVLQDSGEEISLFDACGSLLQGVKYSGGSGSYTTTETIGAISGCSSKSLTINSANNTNLGSSPGSSGDDEGWERNCDGTYSFSTQSTQNPGSNNGCTTVACATLLSSTDLTFWGESVDAKNMLYISYLSSDAERFIVEKSTNGNDFELLNEIYSQNTSNQYYEIEDALPSETNYYRIAVILKNGNVEYSNNLVLNNKSQNKLVKSIAPNPVNNLLNISVSYQKNEQVIITIYNQLGEAVYTNSFEKLYDLNIETSHFSNGIYTVVLSSENETQTERIIIQH